MLKISSYELQEKNMSIVMSKIEERIGKEKYNKKMLTSSMKIRLILQNKINREKNKLNMIDNFYIGKCKYINVMDTVYLKGGIIVDWLIDINNAKITDLDYSVSVEELEKVKMEIDEKEICSDIEKELRWLYKEMIEIEDQINLIFEESDMMEVYNAYDETKPIILYKKNLIKLYKPPRYVKMYKTDITDKIELYRYYYSYYIENEKKQKQEIKLCIVDFSIEKGVDPTKSSLLMQRWIDSKIYIISQSTLSLLNDQLKALLYSSVKLGFKYEKRRNRVMGLLLELTNEEIIKSKLKIKYEIDIKKEKKIEQNPFDIIYIGRWLCNKGINLEDWIVRKKEEEYITKEESQKYVCKMLDDVWPKVIRRLDMSYR